MRVQELPKEALTELKQRWYTELCDDEGTPVYMSDLAEINDIVPDEEIFNEYINDEFVKDDFFCLAS